MTATPLAEGGRRLSVLYSFPHALGASGIGWTAWNQVNELARAGHILHVVAGSIAKPIENVASVRTTLTALGRRVPHRLLGRDRSLAFHDLIVARSIDRLHNTGKPAVDVVHAWPLAAVRTFAAAARAGIPAVREVPNTHTEHAYDVVARESASLGLTPRKGASHTANSRRLATERREWDAATALLVPSEAVAASFRERGFDPRRLLRHRYGSNAAPYPRALSSETFTAVFVGRGEPRKGLHYALQAWIASEASQRGQFLIYGAVESEYEAYLQRWLSHPSVQLRGVTGDAMRVFANSDVMLLPSVEEGSALVTYEAQVAGCVPLVSAAAGAVIDEEATGWTHEVGDVAALTRQLDLLASRPEVLRGMQSAAMRRADELSWGAAARMQVAAYCAAEALTGELNGAAAR